MSGRFGSFLFRINDGIFAFDYQIVDPVFGINRGVSGVVEFFKVGLIFGKEQVRPALGVEII